MICISICGDGYITIKEECDDQNTIPYDGCFNCQYSCAKNCQICEFGRCIQCLFGYKLKSQYCQPIFGDTLTLDSEQCDDGNNEKFDGCYKCEYSCQIECKLCVNQQCFQCLDGLQLIKNKCEQVCNDNQLAIISIEQCDNIDDIYCNDCVSLCQDNCISCLTFNQCQSCRHPFQLVNGICTSICGDQIVTIGFEECDDGNDIKFDGCYQCQLQCSFGCILCQNNNICTKCDPQFTKLNNSTMKCEQIENEIVIIQEEIIEDDSYNQCGNGLFNSLYEDWNISGGDGCSAYCNIEASFMCVNVEGLLSICTYLETPKFKLEQLSNKKSQQQIIELGFTQKVKLNTVLPFENITIFTVSPPTRYDINIIPLVLCSTKFNQSKYQISIFFKDPVQNPVLKVEIKKLIIINELYYQLLFSAFLQFRDYTFNSAFDIFNSINAITVLLFILLSTIQLLSITATKIKDKRKWKYFYTDFIDRFWAKNYKSFQIYRVIFYIFIIVAFIDCPELQSILLSMLSIIYLIYLISNKPVRSKYDFIKLIFKEIFLMIITGSFLIYSLQLTNEQLLFCGWIHIALFSSMLASSLIIDMINPFIKAYEHYQRLKYQKEINQIQNYFNNRQQRFILHDPENQ